MQVPVCVANTERIPHIRTHGRRGVLQGDIGSRCVEEWAEYQECVQAHLKARKIAVLLQKELAEQDKQR